MSYRLVETMDVVHDRVGLENGKPVVEKALIPSQIHHQDLGISFSNRETAEMLAEVYGMRVVEDDPSDFPPEVMRETLDRIISLNLDSIHQRESSLFDELVRLEKKGTLTERDILALKKFRQYAELELAPTHEDRVEAWLNR